MPRPKTKKELIELSRTNYEKLLVFIKQLPEDKQNAEFPAQYLNRNIRDILAHLHHWHLLLLSWYEQGMKGENPEMPAPGYTWRTVAELNIEIREKYKEVSQLEVFRLLASSFEKVQQFMADHSNAELFEKRKFKWTGSTSLGSYMISATSSHYEWALKLIKKCTKNNLKNENNFRNSESEMLWMRKYNSQRIK